MADGDASEQNPTTPTSDDILTAEEQEKFDRILAKRLEREKASSAKAQERAIEEALAQERERVRIASLSQEEQAKARHEAEMAKLTRERDEQAKELEQARHDLAMSKAQAKLVGLGLPAELAENVIGKDDDETDARIAALSKAVNQLVSKQVDSNLKHGAPTAGSPTKATTEVERMAAVLDGSMGITR